MNHCRFCGARAAAVGSKRGKFRRREYRICRCGDCGFVWVDDPDTDYENIYDERYYRGMGADPLVDYISELEAPDSSVRQFEWQGILEVVGGLTRVDAQTNWLDFGCGNGGLVRFVAGAAGAAIVGYETGWIAQQARQRGIPVLNEEELAGRHFDVVTAIEVLEHVQDPVAVLRRIRSLMKPGGVFFMTTGNVSPFSGRVLQWSYLVPEIHISLFTPPALEAALAQAGFEPERVRFDHGFEKIYAFKVLKNLGFKKQRRWQGWLPWSKITMLLERKFRLQEHPVGWAR